jgi:hypothetical protein
MDMTEYHKDPALSRSDIVRLNLSPLLFRTHVDEDKPHYRIGRALHSFVLEGVVPTINPDLLRTRKGKTFQKENPDAVSPETVVLLRAMAERARPFFTSGQAEVSFFWEQDGIMCKCRPDWLTSDTVYDFKTTRQSLEDFHWDVRKFCYDVQALWYFKGVEKHLPISNFRFVVIEKIPPHRVRIFELEDLSQAQDMIDRGFSIYSECMLTGEWDKPDMKVYKI